MPPHSSPHAHRRLCDSEAARLHATRGGAAQAPHPARGPQLPAASALLLALAPRADAVGWALGALIALQSPVAAGTSTGPEAPAAGALGGGAAPPAVAGLAASLAAALIRLFASEAEAQSPRHGAAAAGGATGGAAAAADQPPSAAPPARLPEAIGAHWDWGAALHACCSALAAAAAAALRGAPRARAAQELACVVGGASELILEVLGQGPSDGSSADQAPGDSELAQALVGPSLSRPPYLRLCTMHVWRLGVATPLGKGLDRSAPFRAQAHSPALEAAIRALLFADAAPLPPPGAVPGQQRQASDGSGSAPTAALLTSTGLSLFARAALWGCGGGALAASDAQSAHGVAAPAAETPEAPPTGGATEGESTLRSVSVLVAYAAGGNLTAGLQPRIPRGNEAAAASCGVDGEADAVRALAFECIANLARAAVKVAGAGQASACDESGRLPGDAGGPQHMRLRVEEAPLRLAESGGADAHETAAGPSAAGRAVAARLVLAVHAGLCAPSSRVQASACR